MRIAVVFFEGKSRKQILNIAQALVRGVGKQGHHVDLIDGNRTVNSKLTLYKYIICGTESLSLFSGKIPNRVTIFLQESGIVSGKRCFAFIIKRPFSSSRALLKLMKLMESEGMILKNSRVLSSDVEAEEIGRRLHIS